MVELARSLIKDDQMQENQKKFTSEKMVNGYNLHKQHLDLSVASIFD